MKSKTAKINIKRLILLIFILAILVLAALVFFTDILISINGEKELTICYGDEYIDEGASVLWNMGKAQAEGTVDNSVIGDYTISYRFLTEEVSRTVHVADLKRPEITINGDADLFLINGRDYIEDGFSALDEIDGDLTDKVQINSDLDINTDGTYQIEYVVFDKAGNGARAHRNVTVSSASPLTMDIYDFALSPFYDDVICKEVPYDDEKFSKIMFFGDSFIGNMAYYGVIPWSQTITRPSVSTDEDELSGLPMFIHGEWTDWTFYQSLEYYQPDYLILLINCDWTGRWTPEYLYESGENAYAKMQSISPNTQIILCSLCPVDAWYGTYEYTVNTNFDRNDRINKMNVYMCELCRKYNMKFINAAEAVKDPDTGACLPQYISDDMIHLSIPGFEVVGDYIRNHMDF